MGGIAMGDLHRLATCRRCRRVFVAGPREQVCPDCRRQRSRPARRALLGWSAVGVFGLGSVGLGILSGLLHPAWTGPGAWLGGVAALVYLARV